MSAEPTVRQAISERMIGIPAGEIVLRDEGTKTNWKVEVGDFWLAPYPVTRELYRAVRGEAPSGSAGPCTPVTEVSWKEAVRFCNELSQATGLRPCYSMGDDPDGRDVVCDGEADGYRLPSEAGVVPPQEPPGLSHRRPRIPARPIAVSGVTCQAGVDGCRPRRSGAGRPGPSGAAERAPAAPAAGRGDGRLGG
jgi:hypothetical protein